AALRHQHQIAAQRQGSTQSDGGAVDRGHHRKPKVDHRVQDVRRLRGDAIPVAKRAVLRLQEGEIASATEGFTGSGKHHATSTSVTLQTAPDVQQFVVQGGVDDVEVIGT